jgi:hypothetical protein
MGSTSEPRSQEQIPSWPWEQALGQTLNNGWINMDEYGNACDERFAGFTTPKWA